MIKPSNGVILRKSMHLTYSPTHGLFPICSQIDICNKLGVSKTVLELYVRGFGWDNLRGYTIKEKQGDERMAVRAMNDFLKTLEEAPADVQENLRQLCRERGMEEFLEKAKNAFQVN